MSTLPQIGFVGVGNMGWPMAANLICGGYQVQVSDHRRVQADNFVQQVGGFAPDSVAQLAAGCDMVITMLPAGRHVEAAYAEIFAHAKAARLFIDSSTIDVGTAKKVAAASPVP